MSSTSDLVVEARELSRVYETRYARTTAVRTATFSLRRGESVAVVGPSGSGKSTLLQIIAGLDDPSAGDLDWPLLGAKAALRPARIAMMFQSPSLLPTLDVLENTMLPLALLGTMDDAQPRVRLALATFGIEPLAAMLPQELSGGQAQRVALARAIVTDPALLVADEPTGQLDHATAVLVMDELREWAASTGAALILATHDPEIAAGMASIWHMQDGTLVRRDCR
jgi:putative ABC transport system ATP-binding protein/lipoprotein-releasing system ATP-binding protein